MRPIVSIASPGNGSGKTSLLSALTGYLTPSAGCVEVLCEVYGRTDWRELRRRIGMVSSSIRQLIPEDDTTLLGLQRN